MMDPVYTQIKTKESADIESCDDHNRVPSKNEVTKKRPVRRSCLQQCCRITLIIIGVLLALLIGLLAASYWWFSHQVQTWTTTTSPINGMPTVVVPVEELDTFKNKVEAFEKYLQVGVSDTTPKPIPLKVTERNLNGLASDSDFWEGRTYTHLVPNKVAIDICLPMDEFPGGKGRYLVGKKTLLWDPDTSEIHTKFVLETSSAERVFYNATFHFGKDIISGMSLTTLSAYFAPMDWTASQNFLDEHRNLLGSLSQDEKEWLSRIKRVALKDEKMIIRAASVDDMVPIHRRLLGEAAETLSKKVGWKAQLARHLVGF